MKKLLAVLLMLTLVLSFTACGNNESDVEGSLKTEETDTNETTDKTTEDEEVDLSMGHAEGNVYESDFIGIGFKLPENWTFYTDEQIQQLNNITGDMLDEEIAEMIENADIIYDMYAQDTTTGNSVNINLEKMNPVSSAFSTAEQYVNLSLASLKDTLLSMGFAEVTTEATTVTLAGEECYAIDVVCTADQVALYEKVVCKKVGSYMVNITVATITTNHTDTILSQFYALD